MPKPSRVTKCCKFILSKVSKDMCVPLVPKFFLHFQLTWVMRNFYILTTNTMNFVAKWDVWSVFYDIGKSQLAHLAKAMCRGLSGKRASVCNLPEPTLADSRASHVQTPEAICYRRSYWYSEKERKINFSFALLSFFRNFAITKQTFKTYLIYEKN